jgi:hypothetical protein
LAPVWLRVYPACERLGWLLGRDQSDARHTARDVLGVLGTVPDFPFDRPDPRRSKPGTAEAVVEASPEVRVTTDAKERGFRRPGEWDRQEPFYSGRKKWRAAKNQVARTPGGRIVSVSATAPGRAHDLTVLRCSGLLDRSPPGAGVMTDEGYTGVATDAGARPVVTPARATRSRPLTDGQKAPNRLINGCRVVVEHVMARLSRVRVLRQTFRGAFGRHTRVFRVVALVVRRRSAATPLKTYPAAAWRTPGGGATGPTLVAQRP